NRCRISGRLFSESVPTAVAKKDSSFKGSRYPEKPKPRAIAKRKKPVSQVSSRGFRYAFRSRVLNMCTTSERIIRCALQQWMERISQPKGTLAVTNRIDSYEVASPGW